MRLKKLKIIGFKSFADAVTLDFDAEIIGIVGPNGCGKSNIVDAFRWVMGEQSAKSMRGDKMQDVLFAGSDKRKPLNYAEVSVTLTDIDGELPIEYEELTITRRLHRSGESEYMINKQPARLKDIQQLFMGSGIGKNALSIFEQGKLDQVIHLSPLERRAIFDESAGIGRFLQQKKESLRKLEQVTENYNRVKDVHAEVDKQTKTLRKQAAQARAYQENKTQLESLEKALLVARFETASEKTKQWTSDYQLTKEEIKKLQIALQTREKRLEIIKKNLTDKEIELRACQEKVYQAQSAVKIKKAEEERSRQQIAELEEREKKLLKEIEENIQKRKGTLAERQKKESQIAELQKQKEIEQQEVQEAYRKLQTLENDVHLLRESLQKAQKNRVEESQNEGQLSAQFQEKKVRLETSQSRFEEMCRYAELKEKELKKAESEAEEKKKAVAELSSHIGVLEKELSEQGKRLQQLQEKSLSCEKELKGILHEKTDLEARKKSLERLREEAEGFSSGAKHLLKESKNPKSPLFGKIEGLFEYISPKKGSEKIIAKALKPYAQALVVKTVKDLELILTHAEGQKWKDFSLVCLEHISEGLEKGDLVVKAQKHPLASHFLSDVKLIDHLDEVKAGSIFLLQENVWIDAKGVFYSFSEGKEESNAFLREAELKNLEEKLVNLTAFQKEKEAVLKELHEEKSEVEKRLKGKEEERRKQEMSLLQLNFSLQQILAQAAHFKKEIQNSEEEKKRLTLSSKELGEKVIDLQSALALSQKKGELLFKEIHEKEAILQKKVVELKEVKEAHQKKENAFRYLQAQWHQANHEVRLLEAKDQENEQHQQRQSGEIQFCKEKTKELRSRLVSFEADFKALTLEVEELKSSYDALSQQSRRWKEEQEEIEKGISEERTLFNKQEAERHRFEVLMAEDASERKNIERELLDRFQLPIEEAKRAIAPLEMSLEEAEKTIRRLRSEIEKAGAVNLSAIEESKEHEERFAYLDKQLRDLEETKKDLEKIIAKLDVESRKVFKTSFEAIRLIFQKNFQILFNGGEADLKFTDSPDLLEAGIEIIAKPPGKQMRSISLLSGGEKCMTALALLFSLFEVKPAPFCILDEVDAPLDDSNIDRFTNVLRQFIQKTQFIIVTHNKKTMSIADILFGVSMEEKGVSKLISLAFEKQRASAAQ